MGYGMKYTKGNVGKTGKGFPFKEDEELDDLTGRPTRFDKDVPFSEEGKRKKTLPMEGAMTTKELDEFDDRSLDRVEDEAGV